MRPEIEPHADAGEVEIFNEETSSMAETNKFSYFILGVGLGTVIGLLYAPKSGAATLNYLQAKAREGTDFLKSQGGELGNHASETLERGRQTVRQQVKNLVDAVDAGKEAYREAAANKV